MKLRLLAGNGDRIALVAAPFALVGVPLYTAVALLVLPWRGVLFDSWLVVVVGLALYAGSRRFAPAEEARLAAAFGSEWDAYAKAVRIRWL